MPTMSLADEIINENESNVRAILQYGVDLNQIDEYGFTPLIEAAIADNIGLAKLLIQHGADVNLQDSTGGTALTWAAENNNIKLAELLLQYQANPNAYTFAGQPVLTMPLLRNQPEMKKLLQKYGADLSFAQDYINTKLLGHVYELVGTADIVDPKNTFVEIDFEGFYLEFSLGVIGNSLSQFQNHFAARKLRRFSEVTQVVINSLERASYLIKFQQYRVNLQDHMQEIDQVIHHEPLLIPVGYEGHAITFVKLGNIFAKCDRREDSRLYDNIVFYRVDQAQKFTQEFTKNLLYQKKSDDFVNDYLPQILNLQPITELKVEAQISGNCSWANVEAAIPTIFFLLLMSSDNSQSQISNYKNMALNYFQQWREWNKDRTLQFCIQSFRDGDTIRNACKAEILGAILFQRCRYSNMADRERIESILSVLMHPQYEHVLQNYVKTYCYESVSEEGKEFAQMLRAYGYL
ncbi:MAG: ankyrin repeat domain-containing protein [Gammaproteobacteria bacterium]|nr:ankyrin repeat domain-containing protein [Gammaproteobacteria bacterium]